MTSRPTSVIPVNCLRTFAFLCFVLCIIGCTRDLTPARPLAHLSSSEILVNKILSSNIFDTTTIKATGTKVFIRKH